METQPKRKRKPQDRTKAGTTGIVIGVGIGAAIEMYACRKLDNDSNSA